MSEPPTPDPSDDIQKALREAQQQGAPVEVDFDELPQPLPELDEGPRPQPLDDIQAAIIEATQKGAPVEVDFDDLPAPSPSPPAPSLRSPKGEGSLSSPSPKGRGGLGGEGIITTTTPDFWLLLPLFLVFRLLSLALLRPGGFIRDWSDFDTFLGIARLSDYGLYPFLDFWLEWPPLVPWLMVGAYKLSLFLPPWPDDPRLWFVLILGGFFLLFEVGNFLLIYRLAGRLWDDPATISRALWLYAGLFPPLYAMLGFFDTVALFFILLALELLLRDWRFLSAVVGGVGVMVKVVPILALPVALRYLWHRHREKTREAGIEAGLYSVVLALTILFVAAPFLYYGSQWMLASAASMMGRSSWETVWAVAEGYYGFGQVAGDRLNPMEINFAIHESTLPWWLIGLLFAAGYGLLFSRPADYDRPRGLLAFAGLTVAAFLLANKGYSPQFLVYLLPFILLSFPDGRGLTYSLILTGLNVLEQPLYFVMLPTETWLLTTIVVARFVILLALVVEFALEIWPLGEGERYLRAIRRRTPHLLGWLALLGLAVLTPMMFQAYTATHIAESRAGTFVSFIRLQSNAVKDVSLGPGAPRLILDNQATYHELSPYLRDEFDLQLAGGNPLAPGELTNLDRLIEGQEAVWLLSTGPGLAAAMEERGARPLASFDFGGFGTASLYGFGENLPRFVARGRFNGGLELLAHKAEVTEGAVEVTLYWRATTPQTYNLVVFTHLLDDQGNWAAGHDGIPLDGTAPTTAWPPGLVQEDRHRIELPAGFAPGDYTLAAGLYARETGNPLRVLAPNNLDYANRAVPLQVVRIP